MDVRRYERASELYAALSPNGDALGADDSLSDQSPFIFRGQREATWSLYPSAHRVAAAANSWPPVAAQLFEELDSLRRFFAIADDHGLAIPEDSQQLRQLLRDTSRALGMSYFHPAPSK